MFLNGYIHFVNPLFINLSDLPIGPFLIHSPTRKNLAFAFVLYYTGGLFVILFSSL